MNRRSLVLIVALLAFLPPAEQAAKGDQDAKSLPPGQAAADVVVVKLLGESITEKQILVTINQLAIAQKASQQQMQTKDTTFFKDALDTLIGAILLKKEAKEKDITVAKAKIDETLQSVKGQFPGEAQYQQALQQQGLKEEDLRRSIEDNLICQQMLEPVLKDLPGPTDTEIQKFYDENPRYFDAPEQVHAAHIFLRVDRSATPEQKDEIRKRLEGIRVDIESKKTTFAENAKISDDKATAPKGGDLGFFKRGDMLKPIEDTAFSVKPGLLAPIVETEFGYHLIHVIEYKPAGKTPLDKVKPDIKTFLERKIKQDATRQHLDELKATVKIETVMTEEEWIKRRTGK